MSPLSRRPRAVLAAAVVLLALAQISTPVLAAAPPKSAPGVPPDIDALVARIMKSFEVPGLALAIVKDGKVALAKGYGVRKLGEPAPVDAKTLFGIASNTKVFTATALGLLVEEGKIAWDAPVVDYLPWFMMSDPYVTREMTVRDLLVHRRSTYNRRQVAERLRFIKPATSFRSAYAYDNVLYLVAGEVIQAVTGGSWEDFVLERILKRVGMTGSNVRHSAAAEGGNVATPHARVDGAVRPIAPFTSDNTNPAGGINSGAEDMAKWMLVRLARGKLADGTALYSERTARQLETPVTILPNPAPAAELTPLKARFRAYALGLDVRDYRGQLVIDHTGGLPGYVSIVTLLPERNLGVAILTNAESTSAFYALTQQIVDYDLGAPALDWAAAYLKRDARVQAQSDEAVGKSAAGRDAASKPSLPLAKYAGVYTDAWYGDVALEEAGGRLVMRFSKTKALTGDLEHWQYDTFVVRWRDRELRADAYVTFALNPDGSIDRVKMEAVSPETDFSYDFQDLDLRPARKTLH